MKINRQFNYKCFVVLSQKRGGYHLKTTKAQRRQDKIKLKSENYE